MSRDTPRRLLAAAAGLMALWWVGLSWGIPLIIRGAHSGQLPLLGRLLPGRATQPVEGYLALWAPLGRAAVVVGWTVAALVTAALLLRRQARRREREGGPADPPAATSGQVLLIAMWFGLVTGLGEAWYYVSRVFYQHLETAGVFGISQHAVWMTPLANLAAFTLLGLAVLAIWRVLPRRPDPRVVVTGLAWLTLWTWIMVTGRVNGIAAAILGLGLAIQARRVVSPGAGEVAALARRSMGWLCLAVVALGLLVPVTELVRERRQLAEAPPADATTPNVLFIVMDTERATSTSLHGAARPTTPFLEALATRGVWFQLAVAPASWTLPSHAAMFTGHEVRELGVGWTVPLDGRFPTLAEVLSHRGYATAGFVDNAKFLSDLFGLDRGFGRWADQPVSPGTVVRHSWIARHTIEPIRRALGHYQLLERKSADGVNAEFLRWLDHREARPFFAFLNYYDPHNPYLPPPPWNLKFSATQPLAYVDGKRPDADYSATERAELETAYQSSIAYLDNRIESLLGALEERGLLRHTLVIVTADHGEEFGEHGRMEHGFGVTMPLVHVPLVVVMPGTIPAGVRVSAPVELRNLAATVLDLTGGMGGELAGRSLAPYWRARSDTLSRQAAYSTDSGVESLVTDSMQYLEDRQGKSQLFNHQRDPLALIDLSADPAYAGIRDSLRALLHSRRAPPPE